MRSVYGASRSHRRALRLDPLHRGFAGPGVDRQRVERRQQRPRPWLDLRRAGRELPPEQRREVFERGLRPFHEQLEDKMLEQIVHSRVNDEHQTRRRTPA